MVLKEFYVGVKGVICQQNCALLLTRDLGDTFYFDLPGGRVNGEESLEETLTRELKEELPSLKTFSIHEQLGFSRLSKDLDGKGLLLVFYKVIAEPFEVRLSEEHKDFRWIALNELKDLWAQKQPIGSGTYRALEQVLLGNEAPAT